MWTDADTDAIVKELGKVLNQKKLYAELKKELLSKEVFDTTDALSIITSFEIMGHDLEDFRLETNAESLKEWCKSLNI